MSSRQHIVQTNRHNQYIFLANNKHKRPHFNINRTQLRQRPITNPNTHRRHVNRLQRRHRINGTPLITRNLIVNRGRHLHFTRTNNILHRRPSRRHTQNHTHTTTRGTVTMTTTLTLSRHTRSQVHRIQPTHRHRHSTNTRTTTTFSRTTINRINRHPIRHNTHTTRFHNRLLLNQSRITQQVSPPLSPHRSLTLRQLPNRHTPHRRTPQTHTAIRHHPNPIQFLPSRHILFHY